jgi:hypothetical protein
VRDGQLERLKIEKWAGVEADTEKTYGKMPSVLYYGTEGNIVGWGWNTSDALAPTGYPKSEITKVDWFMTLIFPKYYQDIIDNIPFPKTKTHQALIVDFLTKLHILLLASLPLALQDKKISDYYETACYSTLPAEIDVKNYREAIIQSGMGKWLQASDTPFLVEHKAGILHCMDQVRLGLDASHFVTVADCGKGHVSLISYEVEGSDPLRLRSLSNGENRDSYR